MSDQLRINEASSSSKREHDSDSESEISDCAIKRRKCINYLTGKGVEEWIPKQQVIQGDINITNAFKKFRNTNYNEAQRGRNLNRLRVLSLSHIFPNNKFDKTKCITSHLEVQQANSYKLLLKQLVTKIPKSPNKAIIHRKRLVDAMDVDVRDDDNSDGSEEEKEEEGVEAKKDDMMSMVIDLVEELVNKKAKIAKVSEATFTDKFLTPFIRRILLKDTVDTIVYAMIDKCYYDRKKPDFMIGAEVGKIEYYIFFIEVKRPAAQSCYQEEEDYVKLFKQMKTSIDTQLHKGIKNPMSLGVLVEGYKCTLFKMSLTGHGIYTPIALKHFHLVEDYFALINVPFIVEVFYFIKVELLKFVEEVNKKRTNSEKREMRKLVCESFITKFEKNNR